jgi:hypothetical protein
MYANQNTNVASTKRAEVDTRIQKQAYALVEESLKAKEGISEIDDLSEDKPIDENREHERERAEEESGEKEKEIKIDLKKNSKEKKQEELDTTYHILNIKV